MPSQRMVITLVLLLGACCISTYPVYPESNSVQEQHRQAMGQTYTGKISACTYLSHAEGNARQWMLSLSAFGTVSHSILIDKMSKSVLDLMPTDFNLADGAVDFTADSKLLAGLQPSKNLNQALSSLGKGMSHDQKASHGKENKSTLQEDVPDRLVEDLDAVLWKMVAVGELQSQGFTQTDQAPQQPSKRACFWKYCVSK